MNIIDWESCDRTAVLCRGNLATQSSMADSVRAVIAEVRARGDEAVKMYTEKWDGVALDTLQGTMDEATVDVDTQRAIQLAYDNITRFHALQKPAPLALNHDGIALGREYRAIPRVGLYVPAGTAPLISTLLMLAIPAQIAGCRERIVVTPPRADGSIHPAMLYAARLCGVTQLFRCGGAQAIAALAYGTQSIPKVMKIFGPGNAYVMEAKEQVSQDPAGCARDMPAGPSEVLVIADKYANPDFVAADLLAQAEHDTAARAVLVTTDVAFAEKVRDCVMQQAARLTRQSVLKKSINMMQIIVANEMRTCLDISNQYAPEHLILQVDNPSQYLSEIENAGSVFVGPWSTEALGDYASGPNHVLPTCGYARSYSGLGVESFMKSITFQEASQTGLLKLAACVETLASLEGLDGHQNAVVVRRKAAMGETK